jgi:hypothetical protein
MLIELEFYILYNLNYKSHLTTKKATQKYLAHLIQNNITL